LRAALSDTNCLCDLLHERLWIAAEVDQDVAVVREKGPALLCGLGLCHTDIIAEI